MTAGGFPHSEILGSKPCWRLPEAYRSLKRPSSVLSAKASTIRPCKQHTPRKCMAARFLQQIPRRQIITLKMITKRSKQTLKNRVRFEINSKTKIQNHCFARVHYPVLKPPRTATPTRPAHGRPAGTTGIESRQAKAWGGDPGAQKRIRTTPAEHPTTDEPKAHDLFHTSNPSTRDHRAGGFAPDAERHPVFSVERR